VPAPVRTARVTWHVALPLRASPSLLRPVVVMVSVLQRAWRVVWCRSREHCDVSSDAPLCAHRGVTPLLPRCCRTSTLCLSHVYVCGVRVVQRRRAQRRAAPLRARRASTSVARRRCNASSACAASSCLARRQHRHCRRPLRVLPPPPPRRPSLSLVPPPLPPPPSQARLSSPARQSRLLQWPSTRTTTSPVAWRRLPQRQLGESVASCPHVFATRLARVRLVFASCSRHVFRPRITPLPCCGVSSLRLERCWDYVRCPSRPAIARVCLHLQPRCGVESGVRRYRPHRHRGVHWSCEGQGAQRAVRHHG
jgi:hypothetical protein